MRSIKKFSWTSLLAALYLSSITGLAPHSAALANTHNAVPEAVSMCVYPVIKGTDGKHYIVTRTGHEVHIPGLGIDPNAKQIAVYGQGGKKFWYIDQHGHTVEMTDEQVEWGRAQYRRKTSDDPSNQNGSQPKDGTANAPEGANVSLFSAPNSTPPLQGHEQQSALAPTNTQPMTNGYSPGNAIVTSAPINQLQPNGYASGAPLTTVPSTAQPGFATQQINPYPPAQNYANPPVTPPTSMGYQQGAPVSPGGVPYNAQTLYNQQVNTNIPQVPQPEQKKNGLGAAIVNGLAAAGGAMAGAAMTNSLYNDNYYGVPYGMPLYQTGNRYFYWNNGRQVYFQPNRHWSDQWNRQNYDNRRRNDRNRRQPAPQPVVHQAPPPAQHQPFHVSQMGGYNPNRVPRNMRQSQPHISHPSAPHVSMPANRNFARSAAAGGRGRRGR